MRRIFALLGLLVAVSAVEGTIVSDARAQQAQPERPQSQKVVTHTSDNLRVTPHCTVPRDLIRFSHPLGQLLRATSRDAEIHIVALGSSSTAGSGASSPQASYPAKLDAELDRRFPGKDFVVANYGTGGHSAKDMLERIETSIIHHPPSLVLWQTGVNDAINNVGVGAFRETLTRGVRALRAANIDVVLVDMQFYPRAERVVGYEDYLKIMRTVAEEFKIPVFRRFAVMKYLVKSGQHAPEELLAPDNFHLNDLSYGCLADLLADALEEQIRDGRTNASHLHSAFRP